MNTLVKEQQAPKPNQRPAIWPMVMNDIRGLGFGIGITRALITDAMARDAEGTAKYGTPLQPFNTRDPLVDACQEAMDASVYLRQAMEEGVDCKARYQLALQLWVGIRIDLFQRDGR